MRRTIWSLVVIGSGVLTASSAVSLASLGCGDGDAVAAIDASESGPLCDGGPSGSCTSIPAETASMMPPAPSDDAGACHNLPAKTLVASGEADLVVASEPGPSDSGAYLGAYDPSLFYPMGGSAGVLSYSSTAQGDVHTRIATSTDHGATFTFVAEANQVDLETITTTDTSVCGATTCAVKMWHEVSSIVVDGADANAAARYKLFVHTYAAYGPSDLLRRDWGYIGLYTAPAPSGPWSAETPRLGWQSSTPLSSATTQVLTSVAALADCVAFTEPGATVTPNGIDLALTCLSFPGGKLAQRIILLRSTDHAQSFAYAGALLTPSDADCLVSTTHSLSGADLFMANGTEYVMVTPSAPITPNPIAPSGVDYAGCLVIPFADPASASLARVDGGAPRVVRWLAADDGRFTGPCTYAEGATAAGYLVPMVSGLPPPIFHMKRSGIARLAE